MPKRQQRRQTAKSAQGSQHLSKKKDILDTAALNPFQLHRLPLLGKDSKSVPVIAPAAMPNSQYLSNSRSKWSEESEYFAGEPSYAAYLEVKSRGAPALTLHSSLGLQHLDDDNICYNTSYDGPVENAESFVAEWNVGNALEINAKDDESSIDQSSEHEQEKLDDKINSASGNQIQHVAPNYEFQPAHKSVSNAAEDDVAVSEQEEISTEHYMEEDEPSEIFYQNQALFQFYQDRQMQMYNYHQQHYLPDVLISAPLSKPRKQQQQSNDSGTSSSLRKYLCIICNKRFTRPSTLKTHMNSHTGERPYGCPGEGCGWRFTVLSNLKRHTRICLHAVKSEDSSSLSCSRIEPQYSLT